MAKYKANTITTEAQKLINKAVAGISEIQFTRMAFGDGVYQEDDNASSFKKLKNERQSISISSLSIKDNKTVCIEGILTNEELKTGYRITEIGLFAKDKKNSSGEEILYAIAIADEDYADYLPEYNNYSPVKVLQDFYVAVADSSSTTIAVDSNVSVSRTYLEENYYDKNEVDNEIFTYTNGRFQPFSSFEKLNLKEENIKLYKDDKSFSEDTVNQYMDIEEMSEKIIIFVDETCIIKTSFGNSDPYQIMKCLSTNKLYSRTASYVGGHESGHYVYDNWEEVTYG